MLKWPLWMRWALGGTISLIVAVGLWALLAPIPIGGDTAYIVLTGDSMSPRFRKGDLVITRRMAAYQVGDMVAYRHPQIGYVFHRIVDVDRYGRFVLKGDHNRWQDAYHPAPEDIVGRLVWHIRGGGKFLLWLRRPWLLALLTALVGIWVSAGSLKGRARRKNTSRKADKRVVMDRWTGWLIGSVGVLLGGMLLAGLAFTRPVKIPVTQVVPYRHEVAFTYTAPAVPEVYDEEKVRPGEPVFHHLTGTMEVGATYRLETQAPLQEVRGRYRVFAQVRDGRGWERTLELIPETSFSTQDFSIQAVLDLGAIQRFIDLLEKRTGVSRSSYQVVVFLDLDVWARCAARPMHDHWRPGLRFGWDRWELYLINPGPDPTNGPQDPLHPVLEGKITYKTWQSNALVLLGKSLPVVTARFLGVALLLLGAAGAGSLWWQMRKVLTMGDPLTRMRMLAGPRLVAARSLPAPTENWIEVANGEALAQVAERHEEMIFYAEEGNWLHFWVALPHGVYHHTVPRKVVEVSARSVEEGGVRLWPWPMRRYIRETLCATLESWARAVGRLYGDEEHSQRVAALAVRLAQELGVRGRELEYIRWAALLHDLGLSEVPSEVLRKPEALTPHEVELVRRHPVRLREYLDTVPELAPAVEIAAHHHERWDGSGYPDGLQEEEIPLGSRILAVAEVFDALTHDRPYRPAWSEEKALSYLQEQAGRAFDPRIVAALTALYARLDTAASSWEARLGADSRPQRGERKE